MNRKIVRHLNNIPTTINALTIEDEQGDYNIYINPKSGHNGQIEALKHELKHISNNDFESTEKVYAIEKRLRNF